MLRSGLWGALREKSGFTLVELLGVMMIIILLSLAAFPVYAKVEDSAREAKSRDALRLIETALEAYRADPQHSHYPSNLEALVEGGLLKPANLQTPWSSAKNVMYYYYAVDHTGEDRATWYMIGDPGPDATCGGSTPVSPCGELPNLQAWTADPNAPPPAGLLFIRKSR